MHRSKLCNIMIDCSPDTIDASVRFWSGALGKKAILPNEPDDPYVVLREDINGLLVVLQRVNDTSRIHLDIETDDIEEEVQRLERLGAQRHVQVDSWWIMRDPSGHLFCVVPVQSRDFLKKARVWNR